MVTPYYNIFAVSFYNDNSYSKAILSLGLDIFPPNLFLNTSFSTGSHNFS